MYRLDDGVEAELAWLYQSVARPQAGMQLRRPLDAHHVTLAFYFGALDGGTMPFSRM